MKITFDHQAFTMQPYGGISRYYTMLATELLVLNNDVSILAGIHQNNYLSSLPRDVVKGFKIDKYPPKMGRLFQTGIYYWANREIARLNPDIVHETYFSSMAESHKMAPRIVTVFDMIHELFPQSFNKDDGTTQFKKRAFARADHIISISNSTKNDLVRLFDLKPEKISVVHLAAETLPLTQKKLSSLSTTKPFILFVGGRAGYKNFSGLLQAVASSHEMIKEFDIIAFGSGEFNIDELKMIKKLKFGTNQVRQITGPDGVLAELFSSAAAFVYPSLYEGFGLPPLEAMANQCPVISSNTSSMPEVIGDAAEFFNPNNIEEMMTAIEAVVLSASRSAELTRKGLERLKDFSWQKCAQETLDIYKMITG